jgi:uncharacterized membrane protein
MNRTNLIFWIVAAFAGAVCAFIILPAVLLSLGGMEFPYLFSKIAFMKFCHQIPERCFSISGLCLPVCARCTGIYFGFFSGWTLWRFVNREKRFLPVGNFTLLIFLAPLVVDGFLNTAHIINTPSSLRFLFGFLGGAIIARTMWPAIFEAGIILGHYFRKNKTSLRNGPEINPGV